MPTDMTEDGGGLSALRGLRKRSWIWLLTHRRPAHAELVTPCMHLTLPFGRSSISNSFIRIIGKKFRQWVQRTTPCDRSLVGSFSNAVLHSLGSPASCSTQMRRPLLQTVLSTAITTMCGRWKPARNTRTRPLAKIFHQCLVWYFSWSSNRPLRTTRTLDRTCLHGFFGAITARIAGGCAATRSPTDVVHAPRGSSSFQHVRTRITERCFTCAVVLFF
jgi:hypothetical protein